MNRKKKITPCVFINKRDGNAYGKLELRWCFEARDLEKGCVFTITCLEIKLLRGLRFVCKYMSKNVKGSVRIQLKPYKFRFKATKKFTIHNGSLLAKYNVCRIRRSDFTHIPKVCILEMDEGKK